jgi:hypothetical protein
MHLAAFEIVRMVATALGPCEFSAPMALANVSVGFGRQCRWSSYQKENDIPSHESDHQPELNQKSDLVHRCRAWTIFFRHGIANQFELVLEVSG